MFKNNVRIVKEEVFSVKLSEDANIQTTPETISKSKNMPHDLPQNTEHAPVVIIRKSRKVWASKPRLIPVFTGSAYTWETKDDAVIDTIVGKSGNSNASNAEKDTAVNSALPTINVDTAQVRDSIVNNAAPEKTGTSNGSLTAEIFELIRVAIEKAKTYPVLARKKSLEGTVRVSFSITEQGEPADIKILESSGSRILDEATMDIVKKAAPFPFVNAPVEVPVVFRLK